jgi:hypothetical protein
MSMCEHRLCYAMVLWKLYSRFLRFVGECKTKIHLFNFLIPGSTRKYLPSPLALETLRLHYATIHRLHSNDVVLVIRPGNHKSKQYAIILPSLLWERNITNQHTIRGDVPI